jgi:hypothetical protein
VQLNAFAIDTAESVCKDEQRAMGKNLPLYFFNVIV